MAYAAVASLSNTIHLVLSYHQDSISPQFKHQIISIQEVIIFFQLFLEDDPDRANNWEETISEVTDRAEQIIELLLSDSLQELNAQVIKKGKFELHYSFHELERVTLEIESIVNRMKGMRIENTAGPDDQLTEMISRLCDGSPALETIAIFGIGGLGKTTLARNVYNNRLIDEHFDIRAWSTISTDYYVQRRIVLDLLRCTSKFYTWNVSDLEDELIESLYRNLYGRRYLIVLDDPWSLEAWDKLKLVLPDNGNGSRIILTTRLLDLANSAGHVRKVRFLSEDQSWNLLREKIFKGDPCPSQLESMGMMIARRCRGHPLSIEVVSGILAADQIKAAWDDISESIKMLAPEDGDERLHILSMSYTYLPHHLRPCFLYLGIFPEDDEIHVSKLVKLWAAEGFLNESECKSFEETGEEHVEELVGRNLVSVSKRKMDGRIKSITVHDLMRESCLRQANFDNFVSVAKFHKFSRRAAVSNTNSDFLESVYASTIRTIVLYLDDGRLGFRCSIGMARLLRILDLSCAYNFDLTEEVFELFHLRYLSFHCGFCISEAISNLENLQTLIVYPKKHGMCDKLPEGIWRMPQLRHLFLSSFKLPQEGAMFVLENLQTLSRVVDFKCSRANLRAFRNLKKLALLYTKSSRDVVGDYELDNLIHLHKLKTLKIEMDSTYGKHLRMSCAFPLTLKKLRLCGVQLPWNYMKIVALLPDLRILELRNHACTGYTWETSEGGFSQLVFLQIDGSNVRRWITEASHFPKLECLVLRCCWRLLEVPNEIGKIPTLESMELDEQNKSLLSSANRIQKDRPSLGYDPLHIRVV